MIKSIFLGWNKSRVNYCVLRNYKFLMRGEAYYEGKDIDVLIDSESLKQAENVLIKKGFKKIDLNPASHHKGYTIYSRGRLVSFHLHVNGVSGRNIEYLSGQGILKRKVKEGFFYRASDEDTIIVILLHVLLDERGWRPSYIEDIKSLIKKPNISRLKPLLDEHFSVNSDRIIDLLSTKDFKKFERFREEFVRDFNNKNRFLKAIAFYLSSALYLIRRLFFKGILVSVIGMDGTGKTTTTKKLQEILSKSLIRTSLVYMGRGKNNILPIQIFAKLFVNKKVKKNASLTMGKEKKFSLLFTSASFIFFLDLILRYIFFIFPLRIKKDIVIADRYATDLVLMNGVPLWLKNIYLFVLPKPHLTIYLYNDIKTILKRKYHPVDDLKRQEKIYSKMIGLLKAKKIKTKSPEQTISEIMKILWNNF